ncbi:telomere length and silencing protein 1 homolog isoform X2 [Octopus sinensis]|uniref:Telomere length and silencing protein 1 homolog isoform X2 n=1 Tax=Octopus sinensis TaxID=2607531 RepID=A0A7E6EW56_9MOLL|nr:telomere length and silencing protein 1 homolog isoform X2 [Octopus sinensis]
MKMLNLGIRIKLRKSIKSSMTDIKLLQKLREKPRGVNAASLAFGKSTKKDEIEASDPFKMKTGGIVDMKALKNSVSLQGGDIESIGTAFAAETNIRDEDAEMLKYVEEELAKKKGHVTEKSQEKQAHAEDALYQLPENLKVESSTKKSEDMLSNQMLSGIPEIDLGIDAKIRNIEHTEDAKQKLVQEMMKKKDSEVSEFVPTNMAVNFVQHNRFTIEESGPRLKDKHLLLKPKLLRVGDAEKIGEMDKKSRRVAVEPEEKATDDFHYERFKKQMRRY